MTDAKLLTTPPEGSGLTSAVVDRHYHDLITGRPADQFIAIVILQAVEHGERRTAAGRRRRVCYQLTAVEPVRYVDEPAARKLLGAAQDARGATRQARLPLDFSRDEQRRRALLDALDEWAADEPDARDLDALWWRYYDREFEVGLRHASTTRLLEFALHHGAVADLTPDHSDDADDDVDDTPAPTVRVTRPTRIVDGKMRAAGERG